MENVEMKVEGQFLTIVVDLSKSQGPSKSGKTIIVGTTGGNADVEGHPGIKVGLNCYKTR